MNDLDFFDDIENDDLIISKKKVSIDTTVGKAIKDKFAANIDKFMHNLSNKDILAELKDDFNILLDNGWLYHNFIKVPADIEDLQLFISILIYEVMPKDYQLNWLNVSEVTDFSNAFYGLQYNGDISKWDMSNATNINSMFMYSNFSGDISEWNMTSVQNADFLFAYSTFNSDVSKWSMPNLKSIKYLFYNNNIFNFNISGWCPQRIRYAKNAFPEKQIFKDSIKTWNFSSCKDIDELFINISYMF